MTRKDRVKDESTQWPFLDATPRDEKELKAEERGERRDRREKR